MNKLTIVPSYSSSSIPGTSDTGVKILFLGWGFLHSQATPSLQSIDVNFYTQHEAPGHMELTF